MLFADIDDFDGKNLSAWLVIRLPADPAARGLVFAKYNEVYGQHAYDSPVEDTGQSFLDIALD